VPATALGAGFSAATRLEIATLKQIAARGKSARTIRQLALASIGRILDQE
jgi:hypothetical protein